MQSDGVLSDRSGAMIVKPCKQSEIDFYESTAAHPDILPFTPIYMGRLSLGSDTVQAAGALILPGETTPDDTIQPDTATLPVVGHAWAPSYGGKIQTDLAIVLQNIAAGYKKPNILDVKLGARLWADDAPIEKRQRLDKAAEETTSGPLGFRIAGMKTYHEVKGNDAVDSTRDQYKVFDKSYGRSFNVDTVHKGFEDFFLLAPKTTAAGAIKKVIRRFIKDLEEMVEAFQKEESRMYSASLLFVYEGDTAALDRAFTEEADMITSLGDQNLDTAEPANGKITDDAVQGIGVDSNPIDDDDDDEEPDFPPVQSVKLIDFAHARWTPGQGPDENLLHGVRNVMKILQSLIASKSA